MSLSQSEQLLVSMNMSSFIYIKISLFQVDGSKKKVEEDKLKPNSPFIAIIGECSNIITDKSVMGNPEFG